MAKVFLTGAAGFLGHHIAKRLISLGHQVTGVDNLIGGDMENVAWGVDFYREDCRYHNTMTLLMEGHDLVYHCAATAHEGLSVFSPSFITSNIFEASVAVFSAAVTAKVKRIVNCTSMARYGNQRPPFTEDMDPKPVDPYGIAKVAAEQVLRVMGDVHGIEWNIAVPHNIVGPHQKFDDPFRNVMSIMLNRNLQGKPSIIYGDGEQTRCFSYVDDCVSCLEKMGLDPNIKSEIINIGPDEHPVTINELAVACSNETGLNMDPVYYEAGRPCEVKHATCSSDKARRMLGYRTTVGFRESVHRTADYIRKVGTRPFNYHIPLEIVNERTPKTWTDHLI